MDTSNNRLFRWSKPEWLNNNTVRNAGVYTSGALVPTPTYLPTYIPILLHANMKMNEC